MECHFTLYDQLLDLIRKAIRKTPFATIIAAVLFFASSAAPTIWTGNGASASAPSAMTFLVTNTGDNGGLNPAPGAGTGTLRQALIDATAHAGMDSINFNISGPGVQTI